MIDMNVVVTMPKSALEGRLVAVDPHGVLVRIDKPNSTDEIPEKFGVFVPHKNIELVHVTENGNIKNVDENNYKEIFGGR